jgi:hypothetical protein
MVLEPRTAPIYAKVAALIAPTDTPPWLATMLSNWAPSLALDRGVHANQPTKVRMLESLIQIKKATAFLLQALQDAPTREFLEHEGSVRIENLGGLYDALQKLSERAALAAASPQISEVSETSTTAKKGPGKALPANAYSPKTFCAVIISEIWNYLHGEYPPPRNLKAAAAAEAYWQASGGVTRPWGSNPFSSWRYHFEQAKSPTTEKERREICRHCVEHSHVYQMLSGVANN